MQLTNREGTPVDPVPFLVVAISTGVVSYTYGPMYLMALGFDLYQSLAISGGVVVSGTGAAYHRSVWAARPDIQSEVPAAIRIKRLFYAMLIGACLLALLALPLLAI